MPAPKGNQYAKGNKGGRSTLYKPDFAAQAEVVARDEFRQALKAGQDAADDRVERTLYQKALGFTKEVVKPMMGKNGIELVRYTETVDPDTTSIIFWLKNRKPEEWRDKTQTKLTWATKKLSEMTNAE